MKLIELHEAAPKATIPKLGVLTYADCKRQIKIDHDADDINAGRLGIESLKGAPAVVQGDLILDGNLLHDLDGCPNKVGGTLDLSSNYLTNLIGCSERVGGNFKCDNNKLSSLEGAPKSVRWAFFCDNNKLTNLHNIHKHIRTIGNGGAKTGIAFFTRNPITSHVLGLLLIDGLKRVSLDNLGVKVIINKHLAGERDIIACQDELIDAGYGEYAQL